MGQIPIIAKVIRTLGWEKKIIITKHQILQSKIGKNKFVKLANIINFGLEGCTMPDTEFKFEYWNGLWITSSSWSSSTFNKLWRYFFINSINWYRYNFKY